MVVNDLDVKVRNMIVDEVEEDYSCESIYMLTSRRSYNWICPSKSCYLLMDNTGGYGTVNATAEYRFILVNEYNIIIIFHVPRSPYTNVFDLGV